MWLSFFFNDTATTEIYTLSLHDALPISDHERADGVGRRRGVQEAARAVLPEQHLGCLHPVRRSALDPLDRKSTRLNSSHANISYAVFCLKKNTIRSAAQTSKLQTT